MKYNFELYKGDIKVGTMTALDNGTKYEWHIILYPETTFCGMKDTVTLTEAEDWLYERIIPPTRIGIENNLKGMGLQEYDEVDILKFTKGKSVRDDYWVKFIEEIY